MAKKKKGLRNINPGDTVEFLNYITPDHIIRAKYNTGTNGMDITDVPQNLNSYIVLGGGSGVTVEPLSVTSNGIYTAPMGKAYTPVDVNVPVPPSVTVESLSVTSNGTYTAPAGKAYSPVDVNVPATPSVTVESLSVTSNGNYTAPAGKAYSPVDVNVPQKTIESLSVTINGTYNAPTGKAYDPVVVNVPQTTVESLSITSNGIYTAPEGKAYSPITVNVGGGYTDDDLAARNYTGAINLTGSVVRDYAFSESSITSVSGPNVTSGMAYAFSKCSLLTSVSFPIVQRINARAFENCTSLTSVYLPDFKSAGSDYIFSGCTSLQIIVLPSLGVTYNYVSSGTGNYTFYNCTSLQKADLGPIASVQGNAFNGCSNMNVLIIRKNSVATLANINAFNNSPFASGGSGGTLYVPSAQISSYQSASNWTTILGYADNSIQAIEGSIYENAYADGTPIS